MTLGVIGLAAVTAIVAALSKSSKALDNGVGKLPCKCIQLSNLIWDWHSSQVMGWNSERFDYIPRKRPSNHQLRSLECLSCSSSEPCTELSVIMALVRNKRNHRSWQCQTHPVLGTPGKFFDLSGKCLTLSVTRTPGITTSTSMTVTPRRRATPREISSLVHTNHTFPRPAYWNTAR